MYSKYRQSAVTFLVLLVVVGSFLVTWPNGKAYADPPTLDLEIDSPGTIRWDTGNITPGDTGLEPVTLRNIGNVTGYLCIWIGDIVDDEGVNPESETGNTTNPGELSSYLYLDIINEGMTFARLMDNGYIEVELPVSLIDFPADIGHALCITNTPIYAGQSLELQWQWTLPPETGNDVQGDNVSFSINYSLFVDAPVITSNPPGIGELIPEQPAESAYVDNATAKSTPGSETPAKSTPETEPPIEAKVYISEDGRCFIYVPGDVNVMAESRKELLDIFIDIPENIPSIPESFTNASPVYRFYCKTPDGITGSTRLTHDVQLIIYFDPDEIPQNAEVSIFSYHPDSGWIKLDCHGVRSSGWLSVWIDYLDMAVVLVSPQEITKLLAEPVVPDIPDTAEITLDNTILRQVSLGVAVSGTIAMTVLAGIQRRRRNAVRHSKVDDPVDM